jgi:hypothetical protein
VRTPWSRLRIYSFALLALSACKPSATTDPGQDAAATEAATATLAPNRIAAHVAFLADDAQQGRPPGTEADQRVRDYVIEQMKQSGLSPGAGDGWQQAFDFGDGVRPRGGGIAFENVAHDLVPWGHDTSGSGPVKAPLMFAGWGIEAEDYADAKGTIVVVRHGGPDDPHLDPSKLRPQSKLITARDAGAVGFVLWDPDRSAPWSNHGEASDLQIPAVFVGKPGTLSLRMLLGVMKDDPPVGQRSAKPVTLSTAIEPVRRETANVIGRLDGDSSISERRTLVFGAHLDHLGMGGPSSLSPDEAAVHNGADDNASGIAVLLEIAASFGGLPAEARPFDLVFVAFGAEERGLLGSAHMVESMDDASRERIAAMINFDMVGRLGDKLIVNGAGTADEWKQWLPDAAGDVALELVDDGWGPSDHASFYGEGVPVLHFFTGSHEDYHRPTDDIEKVDSDGAATVGGIALRVATRLMSSDAPMTWIELERPRVKASAFRVSLGTMPDYAANVDGLALSGVRKGGPAESAGLRKGDVIVQIGAREIHGIDDYMATFATMAPGESIDFVVERDGERVTVPVVPAAPSH